MADMFDLVRVNDVYKFDKGLDSNNRKIEVGDLVRIQNPPEIYGVVTEISAPSQFSTIQAVQVKLSPHLLTINTTAKNVTLKSKGTK